MFEDEVFVFRTAPDALLRLSILKERSHGIECCSDTDTQHTDAEQVSGDERGPAPCPCHPHLPRALHAPPTFRTLRMGCRVTQERGTAAELRYLNFSIT